MFDLQRIRKLVNWYIFQEYGKNDAEIAKKLGYTKSSFSQILRGKVPVSKIFVDKLCSLDPNINKVWISGKGAMLKNEQLLFQNVSEMPNNFMKEMVLKKIGIPLISAEDIHKYPHHLIDDEGSKEQYYYISDLIDLGTHFMIKMAGDSMEPNIHSGDLLACRQIGKEEPIYWGKIYLIALGSRIQFCRIYQDPINEKQYQIVSDNKETYPTFNCPITSINKIFHVVGVIKML
jgi:phage repressor protein C with HTH and peptisase S24 domain